MNILMVVDQKIPTDLRVENEATSLMRAGHNVGILSVFHYPKSEVIEVKGIKVYQVAISKFHWKKMHGLAGMIPWMDYFIAKEVAKILDNEDYHAIHFHDLYLFGAVGKLKKKYNVHYIGDMHENYVEVVKDYKWATKFPNSLIISHNKWEQKEKEWLADMDKVITVSEGIRNRIIAKGVPEEDVILVPNTIQPRVFENYETDYHIINKFKDYFSLIYVGGFVNNRGLEHVIESMKFLKEHDPKIRLILVGDGEMRESLENLAKEKEVEDVIFFEGWQSQEKIKSYLLPADVGLIPFKRTPQTDNSSSNKLFQYMHFGLPVLGTNCTSVKTLVEKEQCGLIYESENVDQFIEGAIKLYQNKNLSKALGENGRNAVKNTYSWDITVQKMIQMYNQLDKRS